jgi:hypothetical protein
MASKGNTKNAAEEFLRTGSAPEVVTDETQETENLDEQLDELAAEQENAAEATEQPQEEQAEQQVDEAPQGKKEKPGKKEEKTADETAEEDEVKEADGNVADEDPNALPAEIAELPRVQALLETEEQINILKDALAEGYAIDTADFPKAVQQLRLERTDAHMLYQIIDQTLPVGTLLSNLERDFDQKKVVEPIYLNMADHLGKNGFLEAYLDMRGFKLVAKDQAGTGAAAPGTLGQAVNGAAKGNPELQPLVEQIKQLQARLDGKVPGQLGQLTPEEQKHETGFENEIKRLMKDKSVDEKFFPDYKTAIIQMVKQYPGGSRAIMDRIAKGNFVDVRRFFTNHNNAQLERAKAYMKPVTAGSKRIVVKKPSPGNGAASNLKPGAKKIATKQDRISQAIQGLTGKQ